MLNKILYYYYYYYYIMFELCSYQLQLQSLQNWNPVFRQLLSAKLCNTMN